jgi:hypothetical protein
VALVVTHGQQQLQFETTDAVWAAVRKGEVSIEDTVVDRSAPDAVPCAVAELPVRRRLQVPRISIWYLTGAAAAIHFACMGFELPLFVELPVQGALGVLAALRWFSPDRMRAQREARRRLFGGRG